MEISQNFKNEIDDLQRKLFKNLVLGKINLNMRYVSVEWLKDRISHAVELEEYEAAGFLSNILNEMEKKWII